YRPASLSHDLTTKLLRQRLGFNGLIVSDASEMAGVTSFMPEGPAKAEMLRAGCDMILFSNDLDRDLEAIKAALAEGTLSEARIEEALLRVLGLKAALGLHKPAPETRAVSNLRTSRAVDTATEAFQRAPTL